MLFKIIAASIFFGLVVADPITSLSSKELGFMSALINNDSTDLVKTTPDISTVALDLINVLIGYKSSALLIAVDVIDWLVKNSIMVAFGVIATLGFCKFTGKCSFDYEQFVPVSQFRSFVTPERLATAERFLVTAVEKYTEQKKGRQMENAF